ncbi:MAG: hypothetical protein GEU73_09095 [Chloroflexi bacterium]|nr:hypothetical protein [Chloroflexota bacterium]
MPVSLVPGLASLRPATFLAVIFAAGLAAGATLGLFHSVATEPVIDAAIAFEEAAKPHASGSDAVEPIVSRDAQRVGLVVGSLVNGLIFAALVSVAYVVALTRSWVMPGWPGALVVAAGLFWAFGLFPFLKYPATPPGVGDPETIGLRQTLFVACWALSVAGLLGARAVASRLSGPGRARFGLGLLIYAAWSAVVFVLLPSNPDAITIPADLAADFRTRSLAGLTLFWLVLGAAVALLFGRITNWRARPA